MRGVSVAASERSTIRTAIRFGSRTIWYWITSASRANVAFYPVDPRGLTMSNGRTTSAQIMRGLVSDRDAMETLAAETGGRAIVQKNDISAALGQVIRDSRAYYLIAYESPHPDDGKFRELEAHVKRPGVHLRVRKGYWDASPDEAMRAALLAKADEPKRTTLVHHPSHQEGRRTKLN